MNASDSDEILALDMSAFYGWDGYVPQSVIDADRRLHDLEWAHSVQERERAAAEDADEIPMPPPRPPVAAPPVSAAVPAVAVPVELPESPYVDWEQEQRILKHQNAVDLRVEQLHVDRDARAAFAVQVGAFGVFDPGDVIDINRLSDRPAADHLIEGVLERGGITMLFADGFVGKSFLALDWVLSVASGRRWDNRKVAQSRSLYIALEGHATIKNRVAAWRQHFGETIPDAAVTVYPATVNLLDSTSVTALAEYLKREKFDLIIVDTLSRSIAGGDENSSEEMGRFIHSIAELREAHEPSHIVVLHHSKKDDPEKYRGASVLFDGFDNVLCIKRVLPGDDAVSIADPRRRLLFQKVKGGEPGAPVDFIFEQVPSTGSAVLVRDSRAGIDKIVLHLLDMQNGRLTNAGPITRAELKTSLVAAGIYTNVASANTRIGTLITTGVLDLDDTTKEVSVGVIGGRP